jgi:hypothetical protein
MRIVDINIIVNLDINGCDSQYNLIINTLLILLLNEQLKEITLLLFSPQSRIRPERYHYFTSQGLSLHVEEK